MENQNSFEPKNVLNIDKSIRIVDNQKKLILISVFVFLIVSIFSFRYYFKNNNIDEIISVGIDPVEKNCIWRLFSSSKIEKFDIINKKVLNTIPSRQDSNFGFELSKGNTTKIVINSKYIILKDTYFTFVYNKDDLSIFCTEKNIGKLFGKPNIKLSKFAFSFDEENEVFSLTDEKDDEILYYFNSNEILTFKEGEIKFKKNSNAKSLGTIYFNFINSSQIKEKYYHPYIIAYDSNNLVFSYRANNLETAEKYLCGMSKEGKVLWEIPFHVLFKKSNIATPEKLNNATVSDRESKINPKIKDGILYYNNDFDFIYQDEKFRFDVDYLIFHTATLSAIDVKSGNVIWFYNWHNEIEEYTESNIHTNNSGQILTN